VKSEKYTTISLHNRLLYNTQSASELQTLNLLQQTTRYTEVLNKFVKGKQQKELKEFVEHMLEEKTPLVVSRPLLQNFAVALPTLPPDVHKDIAHFALEKIQPRGIAFEEQISVIRVNLAKLYEQEEEWREAAKILIAIPLDTSQRVLEPEYKVNIYVKIAQLFLEDDESVQAEAYINRASELIHQVKDEVPLLQDNPSMLIVSKRCIYQ